MYIPLWLLLAGFVVVVCIIGAMRERHEDKEHKLQERIKELEEKAKPADRLYLGEYETYPDPPNSPLDL